MRLLRSRSLIFDVYGAFVRDLDNWLAVADLVRLMAALDVDEQAVRSSVSRFSRKGLLVRNLRDGQVGYALSQRALEILAEGDLRIYDRLEPARVEDGWALATFSIPEEVRAERHQLRTRLTWLGFGNLGAGLWIAPRRMLVRAEAMVLELGLERYVDLFEAHYQAFDDVENLVARCWDLDRIREAYRDFLAGFEPVLKRWKNTEPSDAPAEAFADYIVALHEWRKVPYLDPGLPPALLPDDWEGVPAAALFAELRDTLEPTGMRFVRSVGTTGR